MKEGLITSAVSSLASVLTVMYLSIAILELQTSGYATIIKLVSALPMLLAFEALMVHSVVYSLISVN